MCLTCPRSFISISTRPILSLLTATHLLFCLLSLSLSVHVPSSEAYILLLVSSCPTSLGIAPLFLSSTLLSPSSPFSVTLPLFSARCDQLGDISPTDIPGDRTSGGHALLHLSSPCLPSVSPLHTWLSCHSRFLLPRRLPPLFLGECKQSRALIPYGADSDI